MGTANRVAKNTLILYARMGITMFISLYSTRLILAALGASDFGIFNVVGGAVAMLMFLNAAMTQATQRFMSYAQGEGDEERQKKIFNASVVMHLVIGIILVVVLELGGLVLFNGILKIDAERMVVARLIYHFLVISTFVKVISVPYDAVINARENMLFVAILGIFEAIVKLAIALYVTYTNFDRLASYGFLMAALAILLLLITRIYCHKNYSEVTIQPIKYFDKTLLKEMTSFAGWSFLVSSSSIVTMQGMSIVLNSFFGVLLNAAQGVANQISGQLLVFSNTMMKALNPVIVKSEGGKNRNQMIFITLLGTKFSFLLLAFFAIPFLLETKYILELWLKDVPDWAVLFCRFEISRNLISQLIIAIQSGISAEGNIKRYSIFRSFTYFAPLPLSIILFSLGLPPYFIYVLWILCWGLVGGIVVVYFANKNYNLSIPFYIKNVLIPSLYIFTITSLIGMIPIMLLGSGFLRLGLVILLTSTSFLITYWFISSNMDERKLIGKIKDRIVHKIKTSTTNFR